MSRQEQAAKADRMPWTFVAGVGLAAFGVISLAGGTPAGGLLALVGLVLIGVGLLLRARR